MKYILNKSQVRTTNNFGINDIKVDLDIKETNFNSYKFSNTKDIIIEESIKNNYNSRIGLPSNKYLNINITPQRDIDKIIINYDFSNDNNYLIYQLLLQDDSVVKVTTVDSGNGLYYILLTDGNVYSYTIKRADRNAPPTISGTSIVYNKSTFGERIIDYNYAGDSSTTYIKLESGRIFRMVASNLKECSKYIDIPCQYELVEDEALFKNKDRIIAYNGNSLITDYHKYFSMSGK